MSELLNGAGAVQYDTTLVLAIELSSKIGVLAAQVPGLPKTKVKRPIEPDKLALQSAIDAYRARAAAAGHPVDRVIATYEAGWSGFWLARWLIAKGIEVPAWPTSPTASPAMSGTSGEVCLRERQSGAEHRCGCQRRSKKQARPEGDTLRFFWGASRAGAAF